MTSTTQETRMTSPEHGTTHESWFNIFGTLQLVVVTAAEMTMEAIGGILPDVETYDDLYDPILFPTSPGSPTAQEVASSAPPRPPKPSTPPESIEMKEPSGPIPDDWVLA
jgi:hypothetical protein